MKTLKRALTMVMALAFVLSFAACGSKAIDMDKIKGDWSATSVDGASMEDYAASLGADTSTCFVNLSIDDENVYLENASGTTTYTFEKKSNGIELIGESGSIELSLTYDKDDNTLSFKAADEAGYVQTFVFEQN